MVRRMCTSKPCPLAAGSGLSQERRALNAKKGVVFPCHGPPWSARSGDVPAGSVTSAKVKPASATSGTRTRGSGGATGCAESDSAARRAEAPPRNGPRRGRRRRSDAMSRPRPAIRRRDDLSMGAGSRRRTPRRAVEAAESRPEQFGCPRRDGGPGPTTRHQRSRPTRPSDGPARRRRRGRQAADRLGLPRQSDERLYRVGRPPGAPPREPPGDVAVPHPRSSASRP